MKLQSAILLLFISALVIFSCAVDPGFDDVPEITYLSISNDTMVQNNLNTDSIFIKIAFKDGDGDLGTNNNVPLIETNGLQSGIEGEITLKVFTTCCIFDDGTPPCSNPIDIPSNQINFEIEMFDDNGNRSNKIVTEFVTLLCQ